MKALTSLKKILPFFLFDSWPQIINQHLCVAEIFGTEVTALLQLSWPLSDTSGRKQEIFNTTFMSLSSITSKPAPDYLQNPVERWYDLYISQMHYIRCFLTYFPDHPKLFKGTTAVMIISSDFWTAAGPQLPGRGRRSGWACDWGEGGLAVAGWLVDTSWLLQKFGKICKGRCCWANMKSGYMFIEIFSTSTVLSLISPLGIVDIHQSILVW